MSRTDRRALQGFSELGRMLQTEPPLQATLLRVAELVTQTLPAVEAASITVVTEDGPYTLVFSGRLAIDLDERQYDAGFGPCLQAARTSQTITVDHDDPNSPYGDFSALARAAGVSHTMSIGLPLRRQMMGGLNIYASSELDQGSCEQAAAFAGYAAAAADNAAGAVVFETSRPPQSWSTMNRSVLG